MKARPAGIEPATFAFGKQRSIQLSYGRIDDSLMNIKNFIDQQSKNPFYYSKNRSKNQFPRKIIEQKSDNNLRDI